MSPRDCGWTRATKPLIVGRLKRVGHHLEPAEPFCMAYVQDTLRDKDGRQSLWASGRAPSKQWG